jgi:predicted N-acetyltransferase YhbS
MPVVVLARLAVASDLQRGGIGQALMRFTFETAIDQSERIGCVGVAVDSKPDAVRYYERFGFKSFDRTGPRSDIVPMFLGLRTIQSAMVPEP